MVDVKSLMSGIAVVIDDALDPEKEDKTDRIFQIVGKVEEELEIPFYTTHEIPSDAICRNLLQSASFILLDWRLWENGSSQLKKEGVRKNIEFLEKAKDFFVPVLIFSNEDPSDIINRLPQSLYELNDEHGEEKNFIFIKGKSELEEGNISDLIEGWIRKNASVYTLKAWEQAFYESKRNLFNSMYEKSLDWPKVFWKSYLDDGVDPSSSITGLVNDMLLGSIRTDIFDKNILESGAHSVAGADIRSLMAEASFVKNEKLPENETRSGDLFARPKGKYLINIRPDCDLLRQGEDVELYCIKGKKMKNKEIKESLDIDKEERFKGRFNERASESISFSLLAGKSIRFNFKDLEIIKFSEVKENRVGRLIHPYITRIQQRYSLYLQRQGLPRIPEEAVKDFIA